MTQNLLGTNVVTQVAIVVRDIEAKSRAWADLLGVPVPAVSLTGPKEESHIRYQGESTDARGSRWVARAVISVSVPPVPCSVSRTGAPASPGTNTCGQAARPPSGGGGTVLPLTRRPRGCSRRAGSRG